MAVGIGMRWWWASKEFDLLWTANRKEASALNDVAPNSFLLICSRLLFSVHFFIPLEYIAFRDSCEFEDKTIIPTANKPVRSILKSGLLGPYTPLLSSTPR